jgi:hypothetical protein
MTDVEELLRESIEARTAGARVPVGLATRAVRRNEHRRRVAVLSAASAVVAAVAMTVVAVGGVGAVAPRPSASRTGPAAPARSAATGLTRAYLTSRIETALGQANGKILVITTHGKASAFGGQVPIIETWSYQNITKADKGLGHVLTTFREVDQNGRSTILLVDYRDRVWWRSSGASAPATYAVNVCSGPADDEPGPGSPAWASFVRSSLACGGLAVAGRTRIDGEPVIKLVGTRKDVDARFVPQTYYVDPVTYLPVRYLIPGAGYREFTWLAATPAHLRLLQVTVPPGFRQVSPPH